MLHTSFFGISNSNGTVPSQTAQDHIGVRFQTGAGFSLYGCHSNTWNYAEVGFHLHLQLFLV